MLHTVFNIHKQKLCVINLILLFVNCNLLDSEF